MVRKEESKWMEAAIKPRVCGRRRQETQLWRQKRPWDTEGPPVSSVTPPVAHTVPTPPPLETHSALMCPFHFPEILRSLGTLPPRYTVPPTFATGIPHGESSGTSADT